MAQAAINGLFQWLKWGTASADTSIGVLTGGDLATDPDARQRTGAGGTEMRRGGLVKIGGNATFDITATNQGLIAAALRASYPRGALTPVFLAGGADDWALQYDSAWITDASIDYAQGAGLKGSVTWGGLTIATCAGSSMGAEANLSLEDYEFVITVEGVEYGVTACGIKIANNVSFSSNANTASAGQKRWPKVRRLGLEVLTLDVTCDTPIPQATLDIWDDLLPANIDAVLVGTNGTDTFTGTLSNLQPTAPSFGFVDANSAAEWKYGFRGSSVAGSMTWAWAS